MPTYVVNPGGHHEDAPYASIMVVDAEDHTELMGRSTELANADLGRFVLDKLARLLEQMPGRSIVTDIQTNERYMVLGGAYRRDTDNVGLLCSPLGQSAVVQWFFPYRRDAFRLRTIHRETTT